MFVWVVNAVSLLPRTVLYAALLCSDRTELLAEAKAVFVSFNSIEETKVHEKFCPLPRLLTLTPL